MNKMLDDLEFIRYIARLDWSDDTPTGQELNHAYQRLLKALTPPTVDDVCKALSEYYGRNVYYEKGYFLYRKEEFYNQPFIIAYKYKSGLVELTKNVLPPHLITLISRFYEGLAVGE